MEEQKIDRRVRKTKRQIRLALTTLMLEKSVGDITVREIAELADVNRGTFYAHYKDVNDLLAQLEENIFRRLEEVEKAHPLQKSDGATFDYLADILVLCGENADVYKALICRNGDLPFQQKLGETLRSQYLRGFLALNCSADDTTIDYFCSFIVSGMLALARDWVNSGMKETPQEIAQKGGQFIMHGIQKLK